MAKRQARRAAPRDYNLVYQPGDEPFEALKPLDHRQRKYLAHWANTGSVTRACQEVGIGRSTVYTWRRRSEEFRAAEKAVTQRIVEELFELALLRARGGIRVETPGGENELPPDGQMIRWLLERMAPERYADPSARAHDRDEVDAFSPAAFFLSADQVPKEALDQLPDPDAPPDDPPQEPAP